MALGENIIYETSTDLENYQVVEKIYSGRFSRLLSAGRSHTDQSGIPLDGKQGMLFSYNQRLVELVKNTKPRKLLIIGGGAFTLPTYLSTKYPSLIIDVVEPDKKLEDIAAKYFNFVPYENIHIYHDYGLHFLKSTEQTYDLVIVDAYKDYAIPAEILSKKFAKYLSKSLKPAGFIAANVISNLAPNSTLRKLHHHYSKYFNYAKVFPAEPGKITYSHTNLIYVTSANPITISLLYPGLSRADFSN